MTVRILFFCMGMIACSYVEAQNVDDYDDDPRTLTEAVVRGRVDSIEHAFIGEAAENPIRLSRLPKAPRVASELTWRDSSRALVAVEFSNSISAEDLYVFLDSTAVGWRISAFRDVQLPGVFYMQLNRYRNMGERSIRNQWQEKWDYAKSRGVSRAEHEGVHGSPDQRVFYVFNLRLTSSADKDLIRHFEFLKPKFEEVRKKLEAMPTSKLPVFHDNPEIGSELSYLLVKEAYHEADSPIRLEISNVVGNSVGYLFCPESSCMPTPTPGGVIALRDLGDGWFLYRTT